MKTAAPQTCRRCFGTGKEPDARIMGQGMKRLRDVRGLRQDFVARAVGISKQYLSDIEHGRRLVTLAVWRKFQQVVNPDEHPTKREILKEARK